VNTSLLRFFNHQVFFLKLTTLQYFLKISSLTSYALRSLFFSCVFFQATRCHAEGILISMCSELLKMGMTETLVAILVEITVVVVVMCIFATSVQLW